jgi:hypothetical protein
MTKKPNKSAGADYYELVWDWLQLLSDLVQS